MEDYHALRLNAVATVEKKKYIYEKKKQKGLILNMTHTFCQLFWKKEKINPATEKNLPKLHERLIGISCL